MATESNAFGSEAEWQSLSDEEQREAWDEFHARCAEGVADSLYFYAVLMKQHLVGYVGH